MRVAVDAMGGDNAPAVEVEGAVAACREFGIPVTLVGDRDRLAEELSRHNANGLDIDIHHASEVVGMDESPQSALRGKKDSSMRVAINLVKSGEVSACVSAGNTGAVMAISYFVLGTLPSVDRPALTPRELEALRWTMEGKTAWEVGAILGISERTAVLHVSNAMHKLGCVNKHQAVLKALRLGLIH